MSKALYTLVFLVPIATIFLAFGAIQHELLPNGHRRADGLDGLPTLVPSRPRVLGALVVLLILLLISMTLAWFTAAFLLTIPVIALALFILLTPSTRWRTR